MHSSTRIRATCSTSPRASKMGGTFRAGCRFDAKARRFTGQPPEDCFDEFRVTVIASDVDGLEASSTFVMRRAVERGG